LAPTPPPPIDTIPPPPPRSPPPYFLLPAARIEEVAELPPPTRAGGRPPVSPGWPGLWCTRCAEEAFELASAGFTTFVSRNWEPGGTAPDRPLPDAAEDAPLADCRSAKMVGGREGGVEVVTLPPDLKDGGKGREPEREDAPEVGDCRDGGWEGEGPEEGFSADDVAAGEAALALGAPLVDHDRASCCFCCCGEAFLASSYAISAA